MRSNQIETSVISEATVTAHNIRNNRQRDLIHSATPLDTTSYHVRYNIQRAARSDTTNNGIKHTQRRHGTQTQRYQIHPDTISDTASYNIRHSQAPQQIQPTHHMRQNCTAYHIQPATLSIQDTLSDRTGHHIKTATISDSTGQHIIYIQIPYQIQAAAMHPNSISDKPAAQILPFVRSVVSIVDVVANHRIHSLSSTWFSFYRSV